MPFTRENPLELLVDDFHGCYVGQVFAQVAVRSCWPDISAEDWTVLEAGPDHEDYSEACDELEGQEGEGAAEGATLTWQDGALWAVAWDHIGDVDEVPEIAERASQAFRDDESLWALYCNLRGALYDGPGHGTWTTERLAELKERAESICQEIESTLPVYWSGDMELEERRIDVLPLLLQEEAGLREILAYV